MKRKYNDEHLNKSITELKSFKLTIIVTIFATIFSLLTIIISNDLYVICSSLDCIKNFSYYLELPFKIASSGVAMAGFIAIIHRSDQTKQQIKLSLDQNNFKNFIDHRTEFYKVASEIENEFSNIKVINKTLFYKELFPENTPKNVELISNWSNPHTAKKNKGLSLIELKPFEFKKRTSEDYSINIDDDDELEESFDFNFYYEDIYSNTTRLISLNRQLIHLYNKEDENYKTLAVQYIAALMYCSASLKILSTKNIKMPKKWKFYLEEESPWSAMDYNEMPEDIINLSDAYIQQDLNLRNYCFPEHNQSLTDNMLSKSSIEKNKNINQIIRELYIEADNRS